MDSDRDRFIRLETGMALGLLGLVAWLATMFKLRDLALRLQARETERRLEALNNEAGRINEAAAKSVNRDVYEADNKATALALSLAKEELDTRKGKGLGWDDARVWIVAGVVVLGAIIGLTR